jgi:hypothetical protein
LKKKERLRIGKVVLGGLKSRGSFEWLRFG